MSDKKKRPAKKAKQQEHPAYKKMTAGKTHRRIKPDDICHCGGRAEASGDDGPLKNVKNPCNASSEWKEVPGSCGGIRVFTM